MLGTLHRIERHRRTDPCAATSIPTSSFASNVWSATRFAAASAKWAFGSLRYLPDGAENPAFILNLRAVPAGRNPRHRTEFRLRLVPRKARCGRCRKWKSARWSARVSAISSSPTVFRTESFRSWIDKEIVDGLAAEIEFHARLSGASASISRRRRIISPSGARQPFRDRSAPPCRPSSRGSTRLLLDLAARRRNPGVPGIGTAMLRPCILFCGEARMNSLSNMFKVAVVGGEGIGPEVTAQSHRVL